MIIAIAFHDLTPEKTEISKRCLQSFFNTVDYKKYNIYFIDNNSCIETKTLLKQYSDGYEVNLITNEENLGTAGAINLAWKNREPGEHCMKIDNDVVWYSYGWIELMEECLRRDPNIGIVGLKRKDCWERPYETHEDKHSDLIYLPQNAGERCLIVEQCRHIMGTVQMYNSDLLDKIGYLYQPSKYGYDDVMASWRSQIAGFKNVFLPHLEIDHIDPGGTEYQSWKERHAGEHTQQVIKEVNEYLAGTRPIYYNPYDIS